MPSLCFTSGANDFELGPYALLTEPDKFPVRQNVRIHASYSMETIKIWAGSCYKPCWRNCSFHALYRAVWRRPICDQSYVLPLHTMSASCMLAWLIYGPYGLNDLLAAVPRASTVSHEAILAMN